jgi:choline dehydrogenase-like flavoprotein
MTRDASYDVVVVGGGFAGAILAKELTLAGKRVLLLEAGTNETFGPNTYAPASYAMHVQNYYAAPAKVPNSPYKEEPQAPQADVLDLPQPPPVGKVPWPKPWDKGYLVQAGAQPFGSDFVRSLGGTSLHWLAESLRMLPSDFATRTNYGFGVDWPITYADLEPYYCRAEEELAVAAEVQDQEVCGIWFSPGYVFPMHRIPLSYSDTYLQTQLASCEVQIPGYPETYPAKVGSTPVSRNSTPNAKYAPNKKRRGKKNAVASYQPIGMTGDPLQGQRCQGNSSCIPICPVQAKYVALKTLADADPALLTISAKSVATKVNVDVNGVVVGIDYISYGEPGSPTLTATGTIYVLACNAIENAKLLLMSAPVANRSGQVGRNLMDHPYPLIWATLAESVGTFRGPGSSAGIDTMRDGPFRATAAAFRVTISNWGWNFAASSPWSDVRDLVAPSPSHRHYRGIRGNAMSGATSGDGPGTFGRDLRTKLYARVSTQMQMGMLVEQDPQPTNTVTLSEELDPLGLPRPLINYDLSPYTKQGIANSVAAARTMISAMGAADQTKYIPGDPQSFEWNGAEYAWRGAGHIMGTHRMGNDPTTSVVDSYGRCHDNPNLFLAGAGNMPTVGTSNPTLTLSALAYRTADKILELLSATGART